ncbi:MAG TPA: hypothetical protein VIF62_07490 [Labilithrix sp.]|jgi:hypothetical protein
MGFSAKRVVLVALLLGGSYALPALAQGTAGSAAPAGTAQAPAAPATGGAAPAGSAAPAKPAGATEGFTFTDKPARRAAAAAPVRAVRRVSGPIATLPGFEETADGGSRLFVDLTQSVPVEERKAPGSITYVLKGAHVNRFNNTNALVTVHFNTPVARARLIPKGNDLLFVIDLRAAATPAFKMNENADHSAVLTIDFAKGDFTNAPVSDQPAATPSKKKRSGNPPAQPVEPSDDNGGGSGPNP